VKRNWMVAGAATAVIAILGGAYIAGNRLFDDAASKPASGKRRAARAPATVVFHETVSDVSLRYPGTWTRRRSTEGDVPLVAVAPDGVTSLLVRVSVTGLEDVTSETLPIVKKFTDPVVKADKTVKLLGPPQAVTLGGLPGYRYRYTYQAGAGAHDHYFFFKRGRMIALVLQVTPGSRLKAAEPQFERLAATFRGTGPS
jgi:hypothetical protein